MHIQSDQRAVPSQESKERLHQDLSRCKLMVKNWSQMVAWLQRQEEIWETFYKKINSMKKSLNRSTKDCSCSKHCNTLMMSFLSQNTQLQEVLDQGILLSHLRKARKTWAALVNEFFWVRQSEELQRLQMKMEIDLIDSDAKFFSNTNS